MNKWKKVKISDSFILQMGKTPSRNEPSFWNNPLYNWVSISDMNQKYICSTKEKISPIALEKTGIKKVPKGTIMLSFKLSLGKVSISALDLYTNEAIMSFFPKNKNEWNIDFLYNYFKWLDWGKKAQKAVKGSTLNKNSLGNIEIPLPPMEEQRKIAARLDAVSDLLAKQKQLLSEQDNLIQSTFYDMFGTPEINEKGFPAHKISEICELNPKKPKEIDDNTECSFVPMSAVSEDGELNLTQIKLYEDVKKGFTYFAEEDVLFAKITPCMENGKGTIAKGLKNKLGFGSTEFHVLRPLNDISNARWLFQITKFKKFRENAEKSMTGSAGQKRVPAGFFDNYFIPVPPLELQQKFAAVAEQIESEKSKIKSAIAETQTLFNSMMSEYFEE